MESKFKPLRPILLLEMSEVPWRVIDRFRGEYPNIDRLFDGAKTFTTVSGGGEDLSPWVAWPSFHRGLSEREHGVRFLGQDPATFKGVPIWEEYRTRGHSIGICGSLQSWPPVNPGPGGFFLPDAFANDDACIPAFVSPFQRYSIAGAAVRGREDLTGLVPLLRSLPRLGIRPATLAQAARHFLKSERRPELQTALRWDVFRKLYSTGTPPAFASFFSSHLAHVLHRHWDHVFPEDFGCGVDAVEYPHLETMRFALALTDRIVGEALEFRKRVPELVVVWASAMGQDTTPAAPAQGGLVVADAAALMQACGLKASHFKVALSMVPRVGVEIRNSKCRLAALRALGEARTASGRELFRTGVVDSKLVITVVQPAPEDLQAGGFQLAGRQFSWMAAAHGAGLKFVRAGAGPVRHIPEGSMAVHGDGLAARDDRECISARHCKAFLLDLAGLGAGRGEAAKARSVG